MSVGVQTSVRVPAFNYFGYIPEVKCWIIWCISAILKCVSKETKKRQSFWLVNFFKKMKNIECFVSELSFT